MIQSMWIGSRLSVMERLSIQSYLEQGHPFHLYGARPAGRLFQQNGKWIRPAQDCSGVYGHRMTLRRIDQLTPDEYSETEIATIEPDWAAGLTATHTLNTAGDLTFIDGCKPARHRGRR